MSGKKNDSGKARHDLIPYHEFFAASGDCPVEMLAEALTYWWAASPRSLDVGVPRRALDGVARVLAFGATKYGDRNWELGIKYSRLFSAAQRHAHALGREELLDPESGLPHEWHFWCNVLFLCVFTSRGRCDLDDRPPAVPAVKRRMEENCAIPTGSPLVNDPRPVKDSN